MPKSTTRAKAEAHEALTLRLTAALAQLTAIAVRHPGGPVPDATRVLAEALLYDSKPFTTGGGRGLPAAAGTVAALASQLAEVEAALEMWEAERSFWNGSCFVWRLTRGEDPLPIQRLRSKAKP
jgi:hypothetical protein